MIDVLLVLKNRQARTKRMMAKRALMTVQQTSVDHLLVSSTGNSEGLDTSVLNIWCDINQNIQAIHYFIYLHSPILQPT